MNKQFRALLQRYSQASARTGSMDQESLGLAYLHSAYDLGLAAGRAEKCVARDEINDTGRRRNEDESGGDSGPDL